MAKQANDIVIFQGKNGAIELRGDFEGETVWATQAQMADLFEVNPQAITKHLKNIYLEGELSEEATCSKMEQVQNEGGRIVKRSIKIYNLDAMISVGYRISSPIGTRFRQWATKTLQKHITEGYTINPSRIEKHYQQFLRVVEEVKGLVSNESSIGAEEVFDLVKFFASTWLSLDAYDRATLPSVGHSKQQVDLTAEALVEALADLRYHLIEKGEASELFGQEKQNGNLEGIVGNVMQSVFGEDAYQTVEEKAAHLLYFIIKNHPFVDGNKRSGAFAFVWFLERTDSLNVRRLSPEALTALTILIAESDPKDKERMVGLVILLLQSSY